jgi:phosphoribosylaminoimidazole-succinocarboxamide synthase
VAYPDPNVVIGKRLDILPVEIVVRGYLAGTTGTSILTLYKKGERSMYGITLPDGLRDNEKLPEAIITPTSKEFDGGHDEPLTPDEIISKKLLTAEQWQTLSTYALALFARGQKLAAERGLILVDTKYEFGTDENGTIILADEIHTPASRALRGATVRRASTRISYVPGSSNAAILIETKFLKFRSHWSSKRLMYI